MYYAHDFIVSTCGWVFYVITIINFVYKYIHMYIQIHVHRMCNFIPKFETAITNIMDHVEDNFF